jgi:hypothetical protein
MPGGGGAVSNWGDMRGGLEATGGVANPGAPPVNGRQGPTMTQMRPSGVDSVMWNELQNCANRLGCCVGVYEPDYIVQEW